MEDPFSRYLGQLVVVDTGTPIVYLGVLKEITANAMILEQADLHDCRDGHANKELYVAEAARAGVSVNRGTVVVSRQFIMSMSPLAEVVAE